MNDRVVLVTGASRGIGAAAARAVAESGASVIAHYGSSVDGAAAAVSALPDDRKLLLQADMAQPGAARGLWREAVAWRGRVDVVVANAAIAPGDAVRVERRGMGRGVGCDSPRQRPRAGQSDPRGGGAFSRDRRRDRHLTLQLGRAAGIGDLLALRLCRLEGGGQGRDADGRPELRPGQRARLCRRAGDRPHRMAEISATSWGGIDKVNAILAMGEMAPRTRWAS